MIDLKQKELWNWQMDNFGEIDELRLSLGMSEEVGEICHHVLKGVQRIREGMDGIDKYQVADGVADTLIYGIQLLSILGLNAEDEISKVIDKVLERDWKSYRNSGVAE